MKNLLLGIAACSLTLSSFAQEGFVCGHDEMRRRLIESDPTFLQREAEYEAEIQQLIRDNAEFRDDHVMITIPVVFHVLHLGGEENVSDEQIHSAIDVLNRDYNKLNINEADPSVDLNTALQHFQDIAGDVRITFALPTIDPLGNCTNGIDRIYSVETLRGRDESKIHPWPRGRYLNVWLTDVIESGAAGYAYKPGSVEGFGQIRDGIMIRHDYTGEIGTSNPNYSRALTHEVGHYFNLDHTWGSTNEPVVGPCGDDGVEDTPLTRGHNNCTNRYDYQCSQTPINAVLNFNDVTTGSGTTDPTPLPQPIAAHNAGTNIADTVGVAIDLSAFTANGLSANSEVAGEFAFSGWSTDSGTIDTGKYYDFYLAPRSGMAMNAQQIQFKVRRSEDGPRNFAVRKDPFNTNQSINIAANPNLQNIPGGGNVVYFVNDSATGFINVIANLGNFPDPTVGVGFRIYAWNADTPEGYFAIDDVQVNGTTGQIENVENFMEYAYCQKLFTEGQTERMRAALESATGQRSSLWQESTLQQVGIAEGFQMNCAPIADFYAMPGGGSGGFNNPVIPYPPLSCSGTTVMFKDNSGGGEANSWSWTFQDGDPATSTDENPTVTFNSSGWKAVTLTVSNDLGSDTKTSDFEVYIATPEEAMVGLGTYGFEQANVGTWPFLHENYEGNITNWRHYQGAGHSGNSCIMLNSGDRDEMDFIDVANSGDYDDLISPLLDLSGMQDVTLSFWYSYSTQTTSMDEATERLEVHRSTDCGRTWSPLTTASASTLDDEDLITNGNSTTPGSWQYKEFNIPNQALTDNVRFRFRFVSSEFSNNLYLDDINIAGPVGIEDATGNGQMSVFPNPTNDRFFVQMTGMDVHPTEITLMDSRGAIILQKVYLPQGGNGITISSSDLGIADGLYVIRASNNEGTSTQKLTVGR